jgi:hypothetical protein
MLTLMQTPQHAPSASRHWLDGLYVLFNKILPRLHG